MQQKTIAFIGAGNMAQAIILGLLKQHFDPKRIIATARTQETLQKLAQLGVRASSDNVWAVQQANVVVLAVKPQMMPQICKEVSHLDMSEKLVISVAAGISSARLYQLLPHLTQLVRAMPNLPCFIGEGLTGLYAKEIKSELKQLAQQLMETVGKTCWVDEESDMNTMIATAGSSPAYFFLLMEAMVEVAEQMGLEKQQARLCVQQAALGSAKLVGSQPQKTLVQLREQVSSKGGTTLEALKVFEQHHFKQMVKQAMQAVVQRADEMEKVL